MDDERFMNRALELARKAEGFTSPNPMVGAVVVKDGRVVGEGYHVAAGQAHAEVTAVAVAGAAARGATLYVNLEPCNHTGRTPPCTETILQAGIRRVVIAMRDPNPHVRGGGSERLAAAGVDITFGVCQDQAEQLNEVFTTFVRTRRPFVIVKWAATLDGRIATRTGDARWVTGPASRAFVHRLRHAVDAIMVGVNTVIVDDPSLTTRIEGFTGKDPRRFILDSNLSLPENARVLHQPSEADTTVVTGPAADGEKRLRLERLGARILVAPLKDRRIDLRALMEMLGSESVTSVLIEGGSRVITAALRAEIVNKVMAFFAPKILGGDDGVPVCIGAGVQWMKDCRALTNVGVQRFEDDVMIEGYLKC